MKVIALNGSPRKQWNTATLLTHALQGAEAHGAQTELIHLYDLDYKGCVSCFACKRKGSASYGKCAVNDALLPVLRKLEEADAVVIGSPIYIGMTTGETRSFLERWLFQYLLYDAKHTVLTPKKLRTGMIYTMNVPEEYLGKSGYYESLGSAEGAIRHIIGPVESLYVTNTWQFDDYSNYDADGFDVEKKAARRRDVFPQDCRKAYEMGERLVQSID